MGRDTDQVSYCPRSITLDLTSVMLLVVVTAPKGVVLRSGVEKASAKVGVAKPGEALELKRIVRKAPWAYGRKRSI